MEDIIMADWVNFAEVRAAVSLEDVLIRFYELSDLKRDGDKLVGPCPVHGGDSPRAFHADLTKNVWRCFSRCQAGGNQLDLVAKKEGVSIREAALKLQAAFMGDRPPLRAGPTPTATVPPSSQSIPARTHTRKDDEGNPPLDLALVLSHDHPHLTEARKLTPLTIATFGVGYCARGILRGMVAIPVHDERGQLVAYAGRRLRPSEIAEEGKYKFPKGFKKDLVLYNLHRVEARDRVIVVEGFFSVMQLHQRGFLDVVATMGAHLSDAHAELLATFKDVLILYDGDEAGRLAATTARDKLADRTVVRVARLPEDTEPEDLSDRALKWLVNGMTVLDLAEASFAYRINRTPTGTDMDTR